MHVVFFSRKSIKLNDISSVVRASGINKRMTNDNTPTLLHNDYYILRGARFSISRSHEPIYLLAHDVDSFKNDSVKHESIFIIQRRHRFIVSIDLFGCGLATVPEGDLINRFGFI